MKLYEIDAAILECINEDGEVVDTDKLAALEMERDIKISNIACLIKSVRAEKEAVSNERKNLKKREDVLEKEDKRLTEFLENYLNGATYKDGRCVVSYRHSTKTEFTGDVNSLRDDLCTITRKESLTAIKAALLAGEVIEGAALVEKDNIQIK